MLKAITEWMNGDYAGKTMLVLRFVFFILFIVTSFTVCFGGGLRKKGGENRFAILSVFAVLALSMFFLYRTFYLKAAGSTD